MKTTAALMLKAPRPGTVKTRLAVDVGVEKATMIYRKLVEHQLLQIPREWGCTIHFTPPDSNDEMRAWLEEFAPAQSTFAPQCQGDLGVRMLEAVRHDLRCGAEAVMLLGGDCPELVTSELRDAACHLHQADLVIGPAADGGYVLFGLKQAYEELFHGILWSTSSVLETTLVRAYALGLKLWMTRVFTDIDDWKSLSEPATEAFARILPADHGVEEVGEA